MRVVLLGLEPVHVISTLSALLLPGDQSDSSPLQRNEHLCCSTEGRFSSSFELSVTNRNIDLREGSLYHRALLQRTTPLTDECSLTCWAGITTGLQITDKQSRRSRICFTGALGLFVYRRIDLLRFVPAWSLMQTPFRHLIESNPIIP